MVFDIGPRIHALFNGIGQSGEARSLRKLHAEVVRLFNHHRVYTKEDKLQLAETVTAQVAYRLDVQADTERKRSVLQLIISLMEYEGWFELPTSKSNSNQTTSQIWEHIEFLERQKKLVENFDDVIESLTEFAATLFTCLWQSLPEPRVGEGIQVRSQLLDNVSDLGSVVHKIAECSFNTRFAEFGMFERLNASLESKLILASGGNPNSPASFNRTVKYANKSDIKDSQELVRAYLAHTPLVDLFAGQWNFTIPTQTRFEHHHILAGSGHGKTQTLQYLIADDLQAIREGKRSIIVLDSQGDLIRNISQLAVFGPNGDLHDRIVIIDPTDVEYPVSLNLFDVGQDRLSGYQALERERLTNSILELYDFVLGTLLDAQMTQKQSVIFRYVTRLMLHIPNATIHTLRELMEPNAADKFADDIAKLSGTARHFFETEFTGREFEQTKKQVLRRLWGILENQTFERMFSHPQSKLDLYSEMNAGKVILINTAKDLLKESGTEIFGRFFIALIAQAAQERAVLPEGARTPTFVYIDEAADYLDANVSTILSQARKYNVGMVLAHQYMGQLSQGLVESFAANTSIKFAGGVSAKDARTMAGAMRCDSSLIEKQHKGSFATYIRGVTKQATSLQFPFGLMEQLPKMSQEERVLLQETMRSRYAVHVTELGSLSEPEEGQGSEGEDSDPLAPTPYW